MYDQTIPRRIRKYRERQEIAGYQLAKMAKISPSYLSLIESGQKLPSVEVAVRLAEALGDDPELYRAWVETADDHDIGARVDRLQKFREVRSGLGRMLHRRGRSRLRSGAPLVDESVEEFSEEDLSTLDGMAQAMEPRRVQESLQIADTLGVVEDLLPFAERPTTWDVPLLREGTDPARSRRGSSQPEGTIAVDLRFLGEDQDPQDLFAYCVTTRSIDRVKNTVLPGDTLVFAANPEGVDTTAIYAVRVGGKIVLSRIVYSEPTLLLMASDAYKEPIQVDVGNEDGLFPVLAGVVVTGIRAWPKPKPAEPQTAQLSLGRTGRFEDGSIVRDCEWRHNYGWRPVQRAEDMDYLDAHPGGTMQFPLIRDGKVKFVLEMNPEQWREALGDYFEGPSWRRNGYIVALTKRVSGEYTEEFQDRWAAFIRKPGASET
jgi:transcriptional regulator with XRE-family HTH domain